MGQRSGQGQLLATVGRLALAGALGIAVGLTVTFLRASSARAVSCFTVNTEAKQADGSLHRGVRASSSGIFVWTDTPTCAHVSSLFEIAANENDNVEVGVGYLGSANSQICGNDFTGSKPRAFTAQFLDSAFSCAWDDQLTTNQYDNFTIEDPTANGHWTFEHDGTSLGTAISTWTAGVPIANGERHADADTAYSQFSGLKYEDSVGWHDWDADKTACTTDSGFMLDSLTDYHIIVEAGAPANLGFCDLSPN